MPVAQEWLDKRYPSSFLTSKPWRRIVRGKLWSLAFLFKKLTGHLDLSDFAGLIELICSCNQLTSLDLTNNVELTYLDCSCNQLTSLDLTNNTQLKILKCYNNQLTELSVNALEQLEKLECDSNQLTSLDLSNNTQLKEFYCSHNQLTSFEHLLQLNPWKLTYLRLDQNSLNEIQSLLGEEVKDFFCLESLKNYQNKCKHFVIAQRPRLFFFQYARENNLLPRDIVYLVNDWLPKIILSEQALLSLERKFPWLFQNECFNNTEKLFSNIQVRKE
jgi:Leucine-rich repeat (LRR) protein